MGDGKERQFLLTTRDGRVDEFREVTHKKSGPTLRVEGWFLPGLLALAVLVALFGGK